MRYFELNYGSPLLGEEIELLGKCWHLVHAIASHHTLAYSVSFPCWRDPVKGPAGQVLRPGVFGPVMRIFGEEATLQTLLEELRSHRLVSSGLVAMSAVRTAPQTETSVCFTRSRRQERLTDGYARRDERRTVSRAQRGDMRGKPLNRAGLEAACANALANFVALRSQSNGQRYSLTVERCANPKKTLASTFGLGMAVPEF